MHRGGTFVSILSPIGRSPALRANLPMGWTDVRGVVEMTGLPMKAVLARSAWDHPDRIPCTITEEPHKRWGKQLRRRYLVTDIEAWLKEHQ